MISTLKLFVDVLIKWLMTQEAHFQSRLWLFLVWTGLNLWFYLRNDYYHQTDCESDLKAEVRRMHEIPPRHLRQGGNKGTEENHSLVVIVRLWEMLWCRGAMWRRINELMCGFADSLSRYLMAIQQWKKWRGGHWVTEWWLKMSSVQTSGTWNHIFQHKFACD